MTEPKKMRATAYKVMKKLKVKANGKTIVLENHFTVYKLMSLSLLSSICNCEYCVNQQYKL